MKKRSFSFIFALLLAMQTVVFTQNNTKFSAQILGQVIDTVTNAPASFVTVKIYATNAEALHTMPLLKAVAADENGRFSLLLNKTGNFTLATEFIGKKTKTLHFSIDSTQAKVDLDKIFITDESTQLAEVQIVATKPLVQMEIDKIIYDMQADPESQTNSVLEMLRKVPMITVDGEENIQLKGSSNFKIYINGKPSNMVSNNPREVLKSMPASSIKKIEVITEPGAKYDAEGVGGIINIVTNSAFAGYTGSVQASIDSRGGYGGGGYFSTKIGKFGITANLNARNGVGGRRFSSSSQEVLDMAMYQNSYRFMNQNSSSENSKFTFLYGNLELSYEMDSLNLISAAAGGMGGNSTQKNNLGQTFMLGVTGDTLSGYETLANSTNGWGGMSANIDYQRSFKKPDRLFTLSYRFNKSPNNSENQSVISDLANFSNTFNPKNTDRILTSNGTTDEHTFQADYVEPFSKKHVLETGVKYILRLNSSDNNYQIRDSLSGEYIVDNSQTDKDLDYRQYILGVYGSYTFKLEKFSIRTGLRFERTASSVQYPNQPAHNFDAKPFANLIPSVIATYRLSDASNLRLTYNQRISRPSIWYLNPFVDNSDPFHISQGNPDLAPEITNAFGLGYTMFNSKININTGIYSSFSNNSIHQVSTMEHSLERKVVLRNTYQNIGKANSTEGDLYVNWTPTKAIRLYSNMALFYQYYKYNAGADIIEKDGFNYFLSGGALITLPLDFRVGANVGYTLPSISLESKDSPYYYVSFNAGKSFFDKKLNLNLRVSEPFRKYREFHSTTFKENVYRLHSANSSSARVLMLNISYRFGEMKAQIKKAERSIENDDLKSSSSGGGGGE